MINKNKLIYAVENLNQTYSFYLTNFYFKIK